MKKSNTLKPKTSKLTSRNDLAKKPETENFLIVGIGASAGGIQALKIFFENVRADSNMAYVVILHLSPDHDSQLAEVLQTVAQIPVTQVKEKVRVEPNHVYVVPPNESLSMADGHIVVSPIHTVEERRAPVDIFFRSLAESHGERSVAVILSGTGANGSMGIKRVKEKGGAAFVQNPREAEFSEMPRNSIATDLIDLILNVSEIPAHIVAYRNNPVKIEIPAEPEKKPEKGKPKLPPQEQALLGIFTQLRVRTGHDFTTYKRATILRRIERRINVRQLPNITAYAAYLRENADETHALLKDLLISVTNFFRDKETFLYLESDILPKLFHGKTSDEQVRVWVAGCATGEEAYSLAMLIAEQTARAENAPTIQIFATDIDEAAIAKAREGFYTLNDAADVSPERLKRFFTKETGGYRIRHELREQILFARHNVIKDPPFSRLDLVTCRNMLIYLNHQAQERVMETFHFSLNAGGYLFLGNSETVDGAGNLYATVRREHHIYQSRHAVPRVGYPVPDASRQSVRFIEPIESEQAPENGHQRNARPPKRMSFANLHQQLLEEYTPSVVVNEEQDIVHMSESSLRFFQMTGGEPTQSLLKLIRPELRLELRTALYQAAQRQKNIEVPNVKIKIDGREELVNICVRPVMRQTDAGRGFILVLFEAAKQIAGETETVYSSDEPVARQLEEELVRTKAQLRSSAEQYDVQAEEFKASNEELQAMNEELRSSSEELETGKEELQSLNEELGTVNQELKIKIEEVSQTSNNLNNLINSTDIGTIFLDRLFRVELFTPAAAQIFNLIPADIGRPLADIANQLEKTDLLSDAKLVLKTLQAVEREVRSVEGRDFVLRVMPYRTKDDKIGGVVLTFYDVTARKRAEDKVRESETRQAFLLKLADAIRPLSDPLEIQRTAMRVLGKHLQADRVLYSEIEPDDRHFVVADNYTRGNVPKMIGRFPLSDYDNAQQSQRRGETFVLSDIRSAGESDEHAAFLAVGVQALVGVPLHKDGRWVASLSVHQGSPRQWSPEETALVNETAERTWAAVERARAEEALARSEEKYRTLFDSIDEGFCLIEVLFNGQGKAADYRFLEINQVFERQSGLENASGKTILELVPDLEPQWAETYGQVARTGETVRFEADVAAMNRVFDIYAFPANASDTIAVLFSDITERKRQEENLAFLAEISKDLVRLTNIDETMGPLCAKIGGHFKVARVVFAEIGEDETTSVIRHEWRQDGLPTLKKAAELKDLLTSKLKSAQRDGDIAYIKDVTAELRDAALTLTALGIASLLGAPLVRDEKLHLYLGILDSQPREWRTDEIELMRELTARIRTRLERAHIEEALQESEARYRLFVNAVSDILYKMNADWSAMRFLEGKNFLADTDNPNLTWLETYIPDTDKHLAHSAIAQAIRTKSVFELEHRVVRADGTIGWTFSRAIPFLDAAGEIVEWFGAATDITERKHAEEALRESEERFRAMFEQANVGIVQVDLEGRLIMPNPGFCEIVGYTAEECRGLSVRDITHPDDYRREEKLTGQLIKGKIPGFSIEKRYVCKDGAIVWGQMTTTVVRHQSNEPLYALAIVEDITGRKRIEEELRESEERLRLLIESASDYAIFTLTPDNLIDSWNTGAQKVFGWTEKEALGKSGAIIFTPEDREKGAHEQEIKTALRDGRAPDERFHIRKDGSRFYASGVMTLLKNKGVQGFAKIARDMTERLEAERAVRDKEIMQRLVGAQEDERKRIARDLHDELGQQLTAMRLKLDAAKKMCKEDEICGKIDEIEFIARSIDNGVDFLAWELRPAALDDLGLIVALDNYVKQWSHHSGVSAELLTSNFKRARFAPETETNLYRIVQEALNNTHKHARAKSVEIVIEKRDDLIVLLIEDDGQGFDPKDKKNKSKGIGLIGMKERAQLIGGTLEIESAPGKGMTVFVRVPATTVKRRNADAE